MIPCVRCHQPHNNKHFYCSNCFEAIKNPNPLIHKEALEVQRFEHVSNPRPKQEFIPQWLRLIKGAKKSKPK